MAEPVTLGKLVEAIYGPKIMREYGLTPAQFREHVEQHGGELPPLKGMDAPACWPHLFCEHL